MLDTIRSFFAELTGATRQSDRFCEDDYRVAAAALLVHALTVDGKMSVVERSKLHDVLERFPINLLYILRRRSSWRIRRG